MRVLFVCTANICRSPMAAAIFAKAAHDRQVPNVFAASAGFLEGGRPVHEHATAILNDLGVDVSRKRSQKLSADVVAKADLVLTMTSEHARGVVGRFPASIVKVYTFRHFASVVAPRPSDICTSDWLVQLNRANKRAYMGDDDVLDIPDPIGHGFGVYEVLGNELVNSLGWIMDCAYPVRAQVG